MAIRSTLKWFVALVLLGGVTGGAYVYSLFQRSDELLRTGILTKFAEIAPEWHLEIGRARFDWSRRVRLEEVSLRPANSTTELITAPELVITVDRERFAESQEVIVQKVRLVSPTLELARDHAGVWTWQTLPPLPKTSNIAPEVEIEQGTIHVRLAQPHNAPPVVLSIQHGDFQAIPSGFRQYILKGQTQIARTGMLTLGGRLDLESRGWALNGQMNDVTTHGELTALAAAASPELRGKLVQVAQALEKFRDFANEPDGQTRSPYALASAVEHQSPRVVAAVPAHGVPQGANPPATSNELSIAALGLSGTLDVGFRVDRSNPEAEPEFEVAMKVRQGQFTHSALPFPLDEISGEVDWNNGRITLRNVSARNGVTHLALAGTIERREDSTPCRLRVGASNVVLDERLRGRLPGMFRKLYDSLQPTGRLDVQVIIDHDDSGRWTTHNLVAKAHGGTVTHVKFPYTVMGVTGTVTQRENELVIDFKGLAGRRPVSVRGLVRDPGEEAELVLNVSAEQLPLDDLVVAACPPEVQKTLQLLKLRGVVDANFRLYRPPGFDQKYEQRFAGRVQNGSIEYKQFPYRLTNLSGLVAFSSTDGVYHFRELKGSHGTATVEGSGVFRRQDEEPNLQLELTATGVPLDRQLHQALPEHLRRIWSDLNPAGTIDLLTTVRWIPDQPLSLSIPVLEVRDGSMLAKAFAYPIDQIRATFAYADGFLEIKSFTGKHEETGVRANGFVEFAADGNWRLRIVEMFADDLVPDRLFRRALPKDLHAVLDELNPRGPVSVSGMLEFRGTSHPDDPVTSAWDLKSVHSGGTMTAGLDLKEVNGEATARGQWDGRRIDMSGTIDLDSVKVLDHQFTQVRGPYRMFDNQLTVGSAEALAARRPGDPPAAIPPEERITARAIGGTFTLDSTVRFEEEPIYRARITLTDGRLEQYASRYIPGANKIKGIMNGWVDLGGEGTSPQQMTGRGQMQINPAALYELPVTMQIFSALPFTPRDSTAFKYAFVDYDIAGGQVHFNRIDLRGDAVNLLGRGSARFHPYDGKLQLDFYSTMPRNALSAIPIVNVVVGEATKGWFGVEVRGTVANPSARYVAAPTIDDTLRRFLGAFEPPPASSMPRLNSLGGRRSPAGPVQSGELPIRQ